MELNTQVNGLLLYISESPLGEPQTEGKIINFRSDSTGTIHRLL